MPIEVLMPALSPTMTEGTLATWQKAEGDTVSAGDVIAEIETDKATMEVEAVDEGVLGRILVPAGSENVAVNTPIALLLAEGEDAAALDGFKAAAAAAPTPPPPPSAPAPTAPAPTAPAPVAPAPVAPAPAAPTAAPAAGGNGHAAGIGARVFASPLARRLARDAGLDLALIAGSGPHGRVVKADVQAAIAAGTGRPSAQPAAAPAAPPAAAPAAAPAAPGAVDAKALADALGQPYRLAKNNNVRKTVARRLLQAKQTVPHFYLSVDCRLDALLKLRRDLNGRAEEPKLSVNDLIIKAVALALRRVPDCNAAWSDDAVLLYDRIDVSVAVATDDGLITPIIQDADNKGLVRISQEMRDLATRAREGKLKPEEFQGGGFTISNLGMFGVREFAAILNPPQAAILAVGQGEQRPVVVDGALEIATMMTCTLSVDHRAVDGAVGARYLQAFKKLVEDPLGMML